MFENQLIKILSTVSSATLSKAFQLYLDTNSLQTECVAWKYDENLLILKLNLWFDKASGVVTSIHIEDKINNIIFYPQDYPLTEVKKLDPSLMIPKLKNFEHYEDQMISITLEDPKEISVVFNGLSSAKLENLTLVFNKGNKSNSIKLTELISEVPTIMGFAELRGVKADIIDMLEYL